MLKYFFTCIFILSQTSFALTADDPTARIQKILNVFETDFKQLGLYP